VVVEIARTRPIPTTEGVVGQRNPGRHVDTHRADPDFGYEIAGGAVVAGEDHTIAIVVLR
jgi:hypothetical protein